MAMVHAAGPLDACASRVKALYSVMQSIENRIGGGEGVEGLYGSINRSGMQKVVDCMREHCGLDTQSRLVDIGSGLGRPLMHALLDPGISSAYGVEIDRIKCDKAAAFVRQTIVELQRRGLVHEGELREPEIRCSAVEQVKSLEGCTHAYSFWEGVPLDGKAAFGRLFAAARSLRAVAVVQRAMRGATTPPEVMGELGFGKLRLVASFSVSMSGSGRSFTCYVFSSLAHAVPLDVPPLLSLGSVGSVQTPGQAREAAGAAAEPSQDKAAQTAAEELEGEGDEAASAPPSQPPQVLMLPSEEGGAGLRRTARQRRPVPTPAGMQGGEERDEEGSRATAVQAQASSRGQRAARRAVVAAMPAAARAPGGGRARSSPRGSPSKSKGVQKSSPPRPALPPARGRAASSLLGSAVGALRQQKAAIARTGATAKPGKAAAAERTEAPTAQRGLLSGLRSVGRSVQQALSPLGEVAPAHVKSQ